MFGFKKKVATVNPEVAESFEKANDNFVKSIDTVQKFIAQVDADLVYLGQVANTLTKAINNIDARVAALEDQLSVKNIKFTNN